MSYDDDWSDPLETRREMIRKTIRPTTIGELRALGAKLFPVVTDPWAEKFGAFLNEHANDRFYEAEAPGAHVVYCRDEGKGIWYIPGSGLGIIQPKGLQALAEIVDNL